MANVSRRRFARAAENAQQSLGLIQALTLTVARLYMPANRATLKLRNE